MSPRGHLGRLGGVCQSGGRAYNEGIFKGTLKVLSFGPGPALALGGVGGEP
jgi:hypothetical protein